LKQGFSGTEQDWRNGQMHLIDKSGTKILPDSGNSASTPGILSFRSVNSSFKRGMNTIGDEVEGSSFTLIDRRNRMMFVRYDPSTLDFAQADRQAKI
jgi:hypothetical protein